MALNRASDLPAADRLSQTQFVKNYCSFSCVVIRFFSVVEIPVKHSSLYNKLCSSILQMSFSLLAHLKHPHVVALQESFFDPAEEQLFIVQVN